MIIPGMVSATFRDKSVERILTLCRQAGLSAVEWSENAHVFPGDRRGSEQLYEKTRDAGLLVAAYGSYYRLGEYQDPEAVFVRTAESAAALKAPVIRIWAGTRPSAAVGDKEFVRLAGEAAVVAQIASDYGMKAAFEWHKDTLTDTNQSAARLLHASGHDNLYCLWQPTADLTMEERLYGLDLLSDRILNLHIYYWKNGEKRPLEEGKEKWLQYLKHADRTVPRYGLLEFVRNAAEEQFLEDAAALHRILGEMQAEYGKE
nr:TIM barrel protein [uncultured Clostridium sp.]